VQTVPTRHNEQALRKEKDLPRGKKTNHTHRQEATGEHASQRHSPARAREARNGNSNHGDRKSNERPALDGQGPRALKVTGRKDAVMTAGRPPWIKLGADVDVREAPDRDSNPPCLWFQQSIKLLTLAALAESEAADVLGGNAHASAVSPRDSESE